MPVQSEGEAQPCADFIVLMEACHFPETPPDNVRRLGVMRILGVECPEGLIRFREMAAALYRVAEDRLKMRVLLMHQSWGCDIFSRNKVELLGMISEIHTYTQYKIDCLLNDFLEPARRALSHRVLAHIPVEAREEGKLVERVLDTPQENNMSDATAALSHLRLT